VYFLLTRVLFAMNLIWFNIARLRCFSTISYLLEALFVYIFSVFFLHLFFTIIARFSITKKPKTRIIIHAVIAFFFLSLTTLVKIIADMPIFKTRSSLVSSK